MHWISIAMSDRQQLEAWIANTRRTQRKLGIALIPAGVVAIAVVLFSRPAGFLALLSVAIVGVFGFWITSSHILDWSTKLDELDKPRPVGRAIKRR
jgi:hypothetical protein